MKRLATILSCTCAALAAGGCQNDLIPSDARIQRGIVEVFSKTPTGPPVDAGPSLAADGSARSHVFGPAPAAGTRRVATAEPWYYARHDRRPYVEHGYDLPVFEESFSRRRDSVRTHNGRARDDYNDTVRTYTLRQTWR